MNIETKTICGENFITVRNSKDFEVVLCECGASIYSMSLNGLPLTVGPKDFKEFLDSPAYFGKTIGRIAGRIHKGILHYKGKEYPLTTNENGNTLHGGIKGLSYQSFHSNIGGTDDKTIVDFYLISPDMDQGFPGEVDLRVRYIIPENESRLRIEYRALAKEETPIGLTNHCYFNLGGHKNILQDRLQISCDQVLTYDKDLIPQEYVEVPSYLDFRSPKTIGEEIENEALSCRGSHGIDHGFHTSQDLGKEPMVILENDRLAMQVSSSYRDVVIYTDNYGPFGRILSNGNIEEIHAAIAIEPQYEAGDFEKMTVTKDGQNNFIEYVFSMKEKL